MQALLDFTDKPNQKAFFFSRDRNVGFWGGYGNGKTFAGCAKGVAHSLGYPGNVGLVGRKTYPALNSTTRESFLSIVRRMNGGTMDPGPSVEGFNKQENILQFRNGSKVYFRTLDEVEKIRSLNLGWALVDQAEEIDEEIYLELNGRIRYWNPERIAEFHAKHGKAKTPFNQLICVGNPSPKAWVKREFFENPSGKNAIFAASTLENKKFLPPEYVSELQSRYPKEWIERFIHGSWDTMLGQIYKELDFANLHGIQPFEIPAHWQRFLAMDFGIVNPTAVLWGAVDEDGNIYIFQEYYQAGKTLEEHTQAIKALCGKAGHTPVTHDGKIHIYADPSIKADYDPAGKSTWEHFVDRGIYCTPANNAVLDGIQNVQMLLHPDPARKFPVWHHRAGQLGAPRLYIVETACPWLCKEIVAYEWEPTREGENAPERPKKFFDHACDAGRYLAAAIRDAKAVPLRTSEQEHREEMQAIAAEIYGLNDDMEPLDD